jgi:hypothetical protein
VRVVHNDASGSGLERSAPPQVGINIYPVPYTPEQFFTDLGVMLIFLLALALIVHLAFMMTGSSPDLPTTN